MQPCFIRGYLFSSVLSFRRNSAPKLASTPKVGVFVPFFPKWFWVSVSVVSHSFLVAFIIVSNIIIIIIIIIISSSSSIVVIGVDLLI